MSEKCGTYAGAQAHSRAGERKCDACLEAQRLYMAKWRQQRSPAVVEEEIRDLARKRAVWRLKELHRADFDLLVADEIRAEKRVRAREAS